MFLQSLSLINFKNYAETSANFCEHINCLVGLNGSGKTNVLDAIHYLSLTKSAFNPIDSQNMRNGESFFVVNGEVNTEKKSCKVHCSLKKGGKKTFKFDDIEYEKLSEHVGKFPTVMIAPNDDELIRESNETRRKFFDSIISQTNPEYLQKLINYTTTLKQRNSALKRFNETGKVDKVLIETYDSILIPASLFIAKKRNKFILEFLPFFQNYYLEISGDNEKVDILYQSRALEENFEQNFKRSLDRDLITQRTNLGTHRDEILFTIDTHPLKKMGSQGQQKSTLLSLKFAQFEFIAKMLKITPVLLLDDIFDKLDDQRIKKMLEIIASDQFGQIFITDAREERTRTLLAQGFEPIKIFRVENQTLTETAL